MWSVAYSVSDSEPLMRTEVETEAALRHWVAGVEVEMGVAPRSIFDEKQYINTPTSKQWGTGYWWLTVEGKTEREGKDEVHLDGRSVPARVLDRRDGGGVRPGQQEVLVSEGPALCPTCGQEVKA